MKIGLRFFDLSIGRVVFAVVLAAALLALPAWAAQSAKGASQKDIVGPVGSGAFGSSVTVLPNGNIVVTDPFYDAGAIADVGAAYLYDGATGTLISKLTGSTAGDQVGYAGSYQPGVTVLSNGNYLVSSLYWNNGGTADVGAVTWGNASTGISGVVSAANSLVGSTANDVIGSVNKVTSLSNGGYGAQRFLGQWRAGRCRGGDVGRRDSGHLWADHGAEQRVRHDGRQQRGNGLDL